MKPAKKITQAAALRMEATDRRHSFTLNYARNQCGDRTFRAVAGLIAEGREVSVLSHAGGLGFLVDGSYEDWTEVAGR